MVKDVYAGQKRRGIVLVAIALLIVALASAIILQERPRTMTEKQVAQIIENPQNYYGDKVTISGNVGSILGSRAFTIAGSGVPGSKLLIISKTPIEPIGGSAPGMSMFQPSDHVAISGHVEYFSMQNVEKELGTDLTPSIFLPWQGQPVIVADQVQKSH